MSKIKKLIPVAVRILFGLQFLVAGLNGFFNFMPIPEMPAAAGAFMGALVDTGYMFPLIKGVEVLAAVMLLANWRAPLALVLLAPIVVNIVLFHLVLAPNLGTVVMLLAMHGFLAWHYRSVYAPLLQLNKPA